MEQLSQTEAAELKAKLQRHIAKHCILSGEDFTLSAGSSSSVYFDCKKATLDGRFLNSVAKYVCTQLVPQLPTQPNVVGGLTMGADFITAAIAMYSTANGGTIDRGSVVRKEPKKHGTKNRIENESENRDILVVEDVITSGGSIARACDEYLAAGYNIIAMLTIVDREAGGKQMLEDKYGVPVHALFTSADFAEHTGD